MGYRDVNRGPPVDFKKIEGSKKNLRFKKNPKQKH